MSENTVHIFISAAMGGLTIGAVSALRAYSTGKILGMSSVAGGLVKGKTSIDRLMIALGVIIGGFIAGILIPDNFHPLELNRIDYYRGILSGLLVGLGTSMSNGCTSGHGINGLARFSPRSLVAVCVFMASGMATATICKTGKATLPVRDGIKLIGLIICFIAAVILLVGSLILTKSILKKNEKELLSVSLPSGEQASDINTNKESLLAEIANKQNKANAVPRNIVELLCGVVFSIGIGMAGMADAGRTGNFLDLGGFVSDPFAWDATLMFVMGFGLLVTTPIYQLVIIPEMKNRGYFDKDIANCTDGSCAAPLNLKYEIPTNNSNWRDQKLIFGAILFGVGWGFGGNCPGALFVGAFGYITAGRSGSSIGLSFVWIASFYIGQYFHHLAISNKSTIDKKKVDSENGSK